MKWTDDIPENNILGKCTEQMTHQHPQCKPEFIVVDMVDVNVSFVVLHTFVYNGDL